MGRVEVEERDTYETMFAVEAYSNESPGEIFLSLFIDMAKPEYGDSVLDAGCGSGKGALALAAAGLNPYLLDLIDARVKEAHVFPFEGGHCLWSSKIPLTLTSKWGYCCDVMEHIPTEFTMLVIANLLREVDDGVFFSISLEPDNFGALIGKQLHKTIQPFIWWRDRLNEVGRIRECRDLLSVGVYLVEAR